MEQEVIVEKRDDSSEAIGASVGGAALGSVIGLGVAVGSVAIPIVGGVLGALGGAAVNWVVRRVIASRAMHRVGESDQK
jgi:hypothetical protein